MLRNKRDPIAAKAFFKKTFQ
ncbi:hypothetical protein [Candidatus Bealeia paramacronuclearis]